jgi:hypothetical protein
MLGMSNVDPRPATTPADEDDLDEIKSAVLAKRIILPRFSFSAA